MGRAVTTALVLHAVETAGGVVFAGLLLRRSPALHRIVTIRPTTLSITLRTLGATMHRWRYVTAKYTVAAVPAAAQ